MRSVTQTSEERDGELQRDHNKVFGTTGLEDGAWELRKDDQNRNGDHKLKSGDELLSFFLFVKRQAF